MLYVQKDRDGNIIGLTQIPGENTEEASLSDPAVRAFLTQTDADMVRVLEDLIEVLVQKNVFSITDLPESAQLKLLYRKNTRSFLGEEQSHGLIDSDNIL